MKVSIIVAMSRNRVIGAGDTIPWHLPKDFEMLKKRTAGKPLVMGRKTHESIGRPLPGRLNVVVTRQKDYASKGCAVVSSLQDGLDLAQSENLDETFVFGGEEIYRQALNDGQVDVIYLTEIDMHVKGDAFFPEFDLQLFEEVERVHHEAEGDTPAFDFVVYERKS